MKALIAQLNFIANRYRSQGAAPREALLKTAAHLVLVPLVERENRRVYVAASGTLIGCQMQGKNAGFTENITWSLRDLITQAEAARLCGKTSTLPRAGPWAPRRWWR